MLKFCSFWSIFFYLSSRSHVREDNGKLLLEQFFDCFVRLTNGAISKLVYHYSNILLFILVWRETRFLWTAALIWWPQPCWLQHIVPLFETVTVFRNFFIKKNLILLNFYWHISSSVTSCYIKKGKQRYQWCFGRFDFSGKDPEFILEYTYKSVPTKSINYLELKTLFQAK